MAGGFLKAEQAAPCRVVKIMVMTTLVYQTGKGERNRKSKSVGGRYKVGRMKINSIINSIYSAELNSAFDDLDPPWSPLKFTRVFVKPVGLTTWVRNSTVGRLNNFQIVF